MLIHNYCGFDGAKLVNSSEITRDIGFLFSDYTSKYALWFVLIAKTAQVIATCTVHSQNIGRTFNLHPYRKVWSLHTVTWKRHTRSLLYQIYNETSLDLNTLAKIVVSIDIKQHI